MRYPRFPKSVSKKLTKSAKKNSLSSCLVWFTHRKNNSFFPSPSISRSPATTILLGCLLWSINELKVWAVSKKPSISRIFFLTYLHTYLESAGKVARYDCDLNSFFLYYRDIYISARHDGCNLYLLVHFLDLCT